MRTLVACTAVVTASMLAPPAEAAAGYSGTSCGVVGVYDELVALGNPASLTEFMYAAVVSADPTVQVRVVCELLLLNQVLHNVDSGAPAPAAVVPPTPALHRNLSTIPSSISPRVCTTVVVGTDSDTSCATVLRQDIPPYEVCDQAMGLCQPGDEYWLATPTFLAG